MKPVEQIPLEQIRQARANLTGVIYRTPLIPLRDEGLDRQIYLKLEVLQPIGSFKLRGAGNRLASVRQVDHVITASAGNMAQGVAWVARQRGIPCTVVMPDHAPQTKLDAVRRLGGRPIQVPFTEWWDTLVNRRFPGLEGLFVHPVSDPEVIAGNATIGLEILEDLPDVDTVIVPFGGGGLSCGIASAMQALKPSVKVYACEVNTACPFSASLVAGKATKIEYRASFVDGIGAGGMLEEMWPLASRILAGSRVVSIEETATALRLLLERNRILAEGAGATALAAALKGGSDDGKTVCVISGGNIDSAKVIQILQGKVPA